MQDGVGISQKRIFEVPRHLGAFREAPIGTPVVSLEIPLCFSQVFLFIRALISLVHIPFVFGQDDTLMKVTVELVPLSC